MPTPTALLVSLTVPEGAGSCASAADDSATHPSAMSQPQASFLSMVLLLTSWIDYTGYRVAPRPPSANEGVGTIGHCADARSSAVPDTGVRDCTTFSARGPRRRAPPYMLRRYCPPTSNSAF